MSTLRNYFFVITLIFCTLGTASASELDKVLAAKKAESLEELLQLIETRKLHESKKNKQRLAAFLKGKSEKRQLLSEADTELVRLQAIADKLDAEVKKNDIFIEALRVQRDKKLGTLRELFGVLQQQSSDASGHIRNSIASAQYPDRYQWLEDFSEKMGKSSELASIEEMEKLWMLLHQEMTVLGEVDAFEGIVVDASGEVRTQNIWRVGAFNLVGSDEYLVYNADTSDIERLQRQPSGRFTSTVDDLTSSPSNSLVAFGVDPTRGSLLSLLIQEKTLSERIGSPFSFLSSDCYLPFCDGQGGYVGSIIILGGLLGIFLAIERLFALYSISNSMKQQMKNPDDISDGNPLGRIFGVYKQFKKSDVETLELKLGEAILSEMPSITRNIQLIQVISVVAPLLGLLGTVIGMILTFQAITLFGTGDPKTMAGGISTALMTTVLGLCAAIPTVLLHSVVSARSKSILHVLEEQSSGIVAEHAESIR